MLERNPLAWQTDQTQDLLRLVVVMIFFLLLFVLGAGDTTTFTSGVNKSRGTYPVRSFVGEDMLVYFVYVFVQFIFPRNGLMRLIVGNEEGLFLISDFSLSKSY